MLRYFVVGGAAAVLLASMACGESSTPENGSSSGSGPGSTIQSCTVKDRTGKSSCSKQQDIPGAPPSDPITCSAGTYCTSAGLNEANCVPGCTSDENCGPSERCVRCGDDKSGSCRACNKTDEEVCNAPPPTPADAAPPEGCKRNTFWDKDCASPGKAYECPDTSQEPEGVGECVQSDQPSVFCCGGGLASKCTRDSTRDQGLCMGKKAYSCPPDEEPAGNCTQAPDGLTYCCN